MDDKKKVIEYACYGVGVWTFVSVFIFLGIPFILFNFVADIFLLCSGILIIASGYYLLKNPKKAKCLSWLTVVCGLIFCVFSIEGLYAVIFVLIPQILVMTAIINVLNPIPLENKSALPPVQKNITIIQPAQKNTPRSDNQNSPYCDVNLDYRTSSSTKANESVKTDFEQVLPYLDQYLKNQKQPLDNLEKFYELLSLKKIDLTPELKEEIKKRIEDSLEEQKKKQREDELSKELFGVSGNPEARKPGPADIIPQSAVAPGATCQVCLSEFSSAEPGAVKCPHCNSLFHYRCIAKWVNKHGTCPICKKELKI